MEGLQKSLGFEPDLYTCDFPALSRWPWAMTLLGICVSPYHSHQFVEGEYEEWNIILRPTDYAIRVHLPRTNQKLKALEQLPPISRWFWGYGEAGTIELFTHPEFKEAMAAIKQAGLEMKKWREAQASFNTEMEAMGFRASSRDATSPRSDLDMFEWFHADMYRNR
jgi:hypothetical protein